jgi:hypothetical protein
VLYYPTQKGAKWVYEYDGGEIVHTITSVEEKDGCKLVVVAKEVDGQLIPLQTIAVSPKGLFQLAESETKSEAPLPLLLLPARPGDKWALNHTTGLLKLTGTVFVGEVELVEVPAGKFSAIRLDWEYKLGDAPQSRTYWYARGVGLVKTKTGTRELRLKSFHLDEDPRRAPAPRAPCPQAAPR